MGVLLFLISWTKNLLANPIFLCIALAVGTFFSGYYYRGKVLDRAVVQEQLEAVQDTTVRYEKIHKKYRSLKPDSVANIERMLSFEACDNCSAAVPHDAQDKAQ